MRPSLAVLSSFHFLFFSSGLIPFWWSMGIIIMITFENFSVSGNTGGASFSQWLYEAGYFIIYTLTDTSNGSRLALIGTGRRGILCFYKMYIFATASVTYLVFIITLQDNNYDYLIFQIPR